MSVIPLVQALRQHPEAWNLLPPSLWRYLDDPIRNSGWYPERDYWVLLAALVKVLPPVDGDLWRHFAQVSVGRDIGVHGQFAKTKDPASFFRRAVSLWSEYHDTGHMEIAGGVVDRNAVVLRLLGFVIPIEGFVRLQGCFVEEYAPACGPSRSDDDAAKYPEGYIQGPGPNTSAALVPPKPKEFERA
jgi:hypothetical protein